MSIRGAPHVCSVFQNTQTCADRVLAHRPDRLTVIDDVAACQQC
jgi:hypothetical protein